MKQHESTPELEALVRERLGAYAALAPDEVRAAEDLSLNPTIAPTQPKRRAARFGALIVALGGGFALTTIAATGGEDGGESTPEAAVEEFIEALGDRDLLGALDVLDPDESAALIDVARQGVSEAARIGLLSDAVNLSDVSGSTIEVDQVELTAETIAPDLVAVRLGGVADISLDPHALPFGVSLSERIGADASPNTTSIDLAQNPLYVATVRRDGRWYVSVGYSLAENLRRASDSPLPPEQPVAPVGADTPDAAVSAFWQHLADLDLAGAAARLAPGEADALRRYSPIWAPSIEQDLADARLDGVSIVVSDLLFTTTGRGDRRRVIPTQYAIEGTLPPSEFGLSIPPFEPDAPTVIFVSSGAGDTRFLVIPAGQPIPTDAELAALDPSTLPSTYPRELGSIGQVNSAQLGSGGALQRYWATAQSDDVDALRTFRYEFSDGCTTISGTVVSASPFSILSQFGSNRIEPVGGGVWRTCEPESIIETLVGPLTLFFGSNITAPRLPSLDVVEIDGQWYVSPARSIMANILATTAQVADGQILSIDSPIATFLYSTDRRGLEQQLVGRAADQISPSCADLVSIGTDGVVTGLVVELPTDHIQECFFNSLDGFLSGVD